MKYGSLIKSGIGVLLVAGAMAPLVAVGEVTTKWSDREGALYDNLRNIQSTPSMVTALRGAQGPIRTEGMESARFSGEGDFYDNLRNIQSSASVQSSTMRGAQGPIRTEGMESAWSSSDGAFYDNLRNIQPF